MEILKLSDAYLEIQKGFTQTIDTVIREMCTSAKEIHPLTSKDYISMSQVPYLCARMEALCLVDDYVRTDIINDELRLIFETGNAFQDIVRDLIADKGILYGMWRCKDCDYVHGSTTGDFTINSRGAKESPLEKRINKPHACGIDIENYGICEGSKFEYIEETIIDEGFKMSGHPDGYIANAIYDDVWELKTVNSYRFRQAKKKPFPEHIEQVMWYAWKANKKNVLITYKNKDTGAYISHRLDVVDSVISNILNRVRQTWAAVKEFEQTGAIEVLPEKVCSSIKDKKAKSCEMCERCFSLDLL